MKKKEKPFIQIVLAWVDRSGLRPTGRNVQKDLNWYPEFETCNKAHAAMWLGKGKREDVDKARAHLNELTGDDLIARRVFTYPLSEREPLERARREILEDCK